MDTESISRSMFKTRGLGSLLAIPQPPETLWLRGTLPPKRHKKLAVVGSRALTRYGQAACEHLIDGLKGYPISIVSGLALGTDACAHKAALSAGLHTIAVPGSGLSDAVIAPRTNFPLAHEILRAGGALLSEHPPETTARPQYFPSRNRIMAGVADAVLLIEAGERSGTLITARLAGEYGRELLCVPHRINDPNGAGSHQFIRLGAALVAEPAHILEALGLDTDTVQSALPLLSESETMLLSLLHEPLPRSELLKRSKLAPDDTLMALLSLDMKGLARERLGRWERL